MTQGNPQRLVARKRRGRLACRYLAAERKSQQAWKIAHQEGPNKEACLQGGAGGRRTGSGGESPSDSQYSCTYAEEIRLMERAEQKRPDMQVPPQPRTSSLAIPVQGNPDCEFNVFREPGGDQSFMQTIKSTRSRSWNIEINRSILLNWNLRSPFAKPSGAQNRRRPDRPELQGHHPARPQLPAAGSPYLTTYIKRERPHPAHI